MANYEEFGRICPDCGSVTIFDRRSLRPGRCARCGCLLGPAQRREVRDVGRDFEVAASYTYPEREPSAPQS